MPIRTLRDYVTSAKPIVQGQPKNIPIGDLQTRAKSIPANPDYYSESPFGTLDIWPSINGATVVTWQQNQNFRGEIDTDAVLVLEFTFTPDAHDSWVRVSEQPLTCRVEDKVNRWRSQVLRGAYRFKIISIGKEWVSAPTNFFQKLSFTEYRTALKIIRSIGRQIYTNSPGLLLKRRWLGVRCTKCNDFLVNAAQEEQCPICYATGFIGGYFEPIECDPGITAAGSDDKVDPGRGPINDAHITATYTAPYFLEMNDIWIDSSTGQRWRVQNNNTVCHIKSVPISFQSIMLRIPASDIAYSFKPDI